MQFLLKLTDLILMIAWYKDTYYPRRMKPRYAEIKLAKVPQWMKEERFTSLRVGLGTAPLGPSLSHTAVPDIYLWPPQWCGLGGDEHVWEVSCPSKGHGQVVGKPGAQGEFTAGPHMESICQNLRTQDPKTGRSKRYLTSYFPVFMLHNLYH